MQTGSSDDCRKDVIAKGTRIFDLSPVVNAAETELVFAATNHCYVFRTRELVANGAFNMCIVLVW
jgi:hypothetical protein